MVDWTHGTIPKHKKNWREEDEKLLILTMVLAMALGLVACGGVDTKEVIDTFNTVNGLDQAEWTYTGVTREQIQAIADVLVELEPMYAQAAALAIENGWEADETAVAELSAVNGLIVAGQYGAADPSEDGENSDMDAVVEQYQTILGAMPDLIAKVSEPYGN